jgi:hypothetical protein
MRKSSRRFLSNSCDDQRQTEVPFAEVVLCVMRPALIMWAALTFHAAGWAPRRTLNGSTFRLFSSIVLDAEF